MAKSNDIPGRDIDSLFSDIDNGSVKDEALNLSIEDYKLLADFIQEPLQKLIEQLNASLTDTASTKAIETLSNAVASINTISQTVINTYKSDTGNQQYIELYNELGNFSDSVSLKIYSFIKNIFETNCTEAEKQINEITNILSGGRIFREQGAVSTKGANILLSKTKEIQNIARNQEDPIDKIKSNRNKSNKETKQTGEKAGENTIQNAKAEFNKGFQEGVNEALKNSPADDEVKGYIKTCANTVGAWIANSNKTTLNEIGINGANDFGKWLTKALDEMSINYSPENLPEFDSEGNEYIKDVFASIIGNKIRFYTEDLSLKDKNGKERSLREILKKGNLSDVNKDDLIKISDYFNDLFDVINIYSKLTGDEDIHLESLYSDIPEIENFFKSILPPEFSTQINKGKYLSIRKPSKVDGKKLSTLEILKEVAELINTTLCSQSSINNSNNETADIVEDNKAVADIKKEINSNNKRTKSNTESKSKSKEGNDNGNCDRTNCPCYKELQDRFDKLEEDYRKLDNEYQELQKALDETQTDLKQAQTKINSLEQQLSNASNKTPSGGSGGSGGGGGGGSNPPDNPNDNPPDDDDNEDKIQDYILDIKGVTEDGKKKIEQTVQKFLSSTFPEGNITKVKVDSDKRGTRGKVTIENGLDTITQTFELISKELLSATLSATEIAELLDQKEYVDADDYLIKTTGQSISTNLDNSKSVAEKMQGDIRDAKTKLDKLLTRAHNKNASKPISDEAYKTKYNVIQNGEEKSASLQGIETSLKEILTGMGNNINNPEEFERLKAQFKTEQSRYEDLEKVVRDATHAAGQLRTRGLDVEEAKTYASYQDLKHKIKNSGAEVNEAEYQKLQNMYSNIWDEKGNIINANLSNADIRAFSDQLEIVKTNYKDIIAEQKEMIKLQKQQKVAQNKTTEIRDKLNNISGGNWNDISTISNNTGISRNRTKQMNKSFRKLFYSSSKYNSDFNNQEFNTKLQQFETEYKKELEIITQINEQEIKRNNTVITRMDILKKLSNVSSVSKNQSLKESLFSSLDSLNDLNSTNAINPNNLKDTFLDPKFIEKLIIECGKLREVAVSIFNLTDENANDNSAINLLNKSQESLISYLKPGTKLPTIQDISSIMKDMYSGADIINTEKAYQENQKLAQSYNQLAIQMTNFKNSNSKFMSNSTFANRYKNMMNVVQNSTNKSEDELRDLHNEWTKFQADVTNSKFSGKSGKDSITSLFSHFNIKSVITGAFGSLGSYVHQMYQSILDIDAAMTELKRVTDETDAVYSRFLDKSGDKAKELGTTMSDMVEATASFARLGYDTEEASNLAENAILYSNVGDLDVETATNDIVSTLKAFNIEASNSIEIVDKLNKVCNNFAISSAEIGGGLSRSASALAAAGNDLNQSIAMITAISEITQDSEAAGSALKILSLRLRGTSTEVEALGEDTDGMITNTSKLQSKLKALTGVDILESDGSSYKSTYQIIDEIAESWNTLDDISQAATLEIIAGTIIPVHIEIYVKNTFNCR